MNLTALIRGKRNTDIPRPAKANPAKVAKVVTISADSEPKLAELATLALATLKTADIVEGMPDFNDMPLTGMEVRGKVEPIPSPVTDWRPEPKACLTDDELRAREQCRFWNQVCHAVGMYQDQCTGTGDSHCGVYRFLERNSR